MKRVLAFTENLTHRQVGLIAIIGTFLLYANTLKNEYALDDAIVITQNEFTKQGVGGIPKILTTDSFTGFFGTQKNLVSGGRYRPLSVISFALEYEAYGLNPAFSHFWNILIYGSIVFLVFVVVYQIFKPQWPATAKSFALFASILFMIHPLHTEVVANIKGRDELFSLLFSLIAFWAALKNFGGFRFWWFMLSLIALFLAFLSKENSLAFVFIIPFTGYFFKQTSLKKSLLLFGVILLPALLFLAIRKNVLGDTSLIAGSELMNNPFLEATTTEKYATLFYTWLGYLKLLFFPHPLTYDYYPYHIPLFNFGSLWVWLAISILTGLFLVWLKNFRSNNLLAYSLTTFAASFVMVSNLFFPVGTFMNERFLFMPSLFWSLWAAGFSIYIFTTPGIHKLVRTSVFVLLLGLLIFFPVKTFTRNQVWFNDFTLFTTDVKTSAGSAKSNCSAGGKLWEYGKELTDTVQKAEAFKQAEMYLIKAVEIHPTYADAWLLLGNVRFDYQRRIESSARCFLKVMQWQPSKEIAWQNFDIVLQQSTDRQLQLNFYEEAFKWNANKYIVNYRLGVLYGRYFNQIDKSIRFLEKATQLDQTKTEAFKDLGTAYGISGNITKAYETFKKALVLNPTDKEIYNNLIVSCLQLGLQNEADVLTKKLAEL